MGQMKKLWQKGQGNDAVRALVLLVSDLHRVLDKIRQAEFLLNDWLIDNTDKVFEEETDIDAARMFLNEALSILEGTNDTGSRPSQATYHSG